MIKGFLYGIATSVTFGLIPLFTLPLMARGMHFESILFYRFVLATLALGVMMKLKGESFRVGRADIPFFLLLGFFYTCSAMFLFWGYDFMGAGVATTLHFTYPVFVTLLMLCFFRERTSWITLLAIMLAIAGVARLSISGDIHFSALGVVIVLLSAVAYASYIVVVNKFGNPAHTRRDVGIEPLPPGRVAHRYFQYHPCAGRAAYRGDTHLGFGGDGTAYGRMYRCVCLQRTLYFVGSSRHVINNSCRNADYPFAEHSARDFASGKKVEGDETGENLMKHIV